MHETRSDPRAHAGIQPGQLQRQHVAIQKQQRVQRLVLCGGRHPLLGGEMAQKPLDRLLGQLARMALAVVQDEAPRPVPVRLLGAVAGIPGPEQPPRAVKQLLVHDCVPRPIRAGSCHEPEMPLSQGGSPVSRKMARYEAKSTRMAGAVKVFYVEFQERSQVWRHCTECYAAQMALYPLRANFRPYIPVPPDSDAESAFSKVLTMESAEF